MVRIPIWLRATVALTGMVACGTACSAILGLDDKPLATDGGLRGDAGADGAALACTADDAGYHDMSQRACWETFAMPLAVDSEPDYAGGTFVAPYVYFASDSDGLVLRYDTRGTFSEPASWLAFPASNVARTGSLPFAGIVTDGRYLYLVPSSSSPVFVRYDTTRSFTSDASWSTYAPPSSVEPFAYVGGTFDGTYVYFAPNTDYGATGTLSAVMRFDTTQSFGAASSWSTFELTTLGSDLASFPPEFFGAVFDGTYAYFVPSGATSLAVVRYDTTKPFTTAASWTSFDTSNIDSLVSGFTGAMFDGTSIYFAPVATSADAVAYDTSRDFTNVASWQSYVPLPGTGTPGNSDAPIFSVGAFDGRFLYYVPGYSGQLVPGATVARDDDTGAFRDTSSWSSYSTKSLKAMSFGSAVFDGQYLYLAPAGGPVTFARFDAKAISSQPKLPYYFGSFF